MTASQPVGAREHMWQGWSEWLGRSEQMVWDEPALFIAGLLFVTLAGALLPIRLEGREDHVVLTISAAVDAALLGPRGLLLVWAAVALAAPVIIVSALVPIRWMPAGIPGAIRSIAWVVVSAVSVSVGFLCANLVFTGVFHREYPLSLHSTEDVLQAAIVSFVGWVGTMSVRLLSHRAISRSFTTDGLDPLESPLIPYLLPLVGGFPLITASVAMYVPTDPWGSLIILWWCFPIYAATVFELRRRLLAQELRRETLAKQRLAAIGEVSARIVHQSRHQVGLMGWSIHRLRALVERTPPEEARAIQRELDALTDAKDRLSKMLASELLHEEGAVRGSTAALSEGDDVSASGGDGNGAAPETSPTLLEVVEEVAEQLRAEADREEVSLSVEIVSGDGAGQASRQLHDVLFNLVDNAIDAAERQVVLELDDGGASRPSIIRVRDDGSGLPGEAVTRAFEPFFTTKSDGTGMGLAIAEALVGDLDGELSYERSATTTTFVVTIPPPRRVERTLFA